MIGFKQIFKQRWYVRWWLVVVMCVMVGVWSWWLWRLYDRLPVLERVLVVDKTFVDVRGSGQWSKGRFQRNSDIQYTDRWSDWWSMLPAMVIAREDRRFYRHRGIDVVGVGRALFANLRHGTIVQGWSTLDQQLLKWHRWHTRRDRSAKFSEMVGAVLLNFFFTKEEIFHAYMDTIPFPNGGVQWYAAACVYYFEKSCVKLFPAELYFLLAVAQYGANPYRESVFPRVKALSVQVCQTLSTWSLAFLWWRSGGGDCTKIAALPPVDVYDLSWSSDALDPRTRLVLETYPSNIFQREFHRKIDELLAVYRPVMEQYAVWDCCVVVIGEAWAIVSYNQCRPYDERVGTVDMCRAPRQTGSAIKPFLYALAFDELGWTGWTVIVDEPVSFDLGDGSLYEPKNFTERFYGAVSVADALGSSLNIPAIKLTHTLWVDRVVSHLNTLRRSYGQMVHRLAWDSVVYSAQELGLSVWLGTYALSPLEFARLRGYRYGPRPVTSTKTALVDILANPLYRVMSFGQDSLLNRSGWFVKTWTSRKFVDGRACGGRVDRERIVCVWVGNHDASSMRTSSVDTAGYLWNLVTRLVDEGSY
jgi:penicillin-binding protein 1C